MPMPMRRRSRAVRPVSLLFVVLGATLAVVVLSKLRSGAGLPSEERPRAEATAAATSDAQDVSAQDSSVASVTATASGNAAPAASSAAASSAATPSARPPTTTTQRKVAPNPNAPKQRPSPCVPSWRDDKGKIHWNTECL